MLSWAVLGSASALGWHERVLLPDAQPAIEGCLAKNHLLATPWQWPQPKGGSVQFIIYLHANTRAGACLRQRLSSQRSDLCRFSLQIPSSLPGLKA